MPDRAGYQRVSIRRPYEIRCLDFRVAFSPACHSSAHEHTPRGMCCQSMPMKHGGKRTARTYEEKLAFRAGTNDRRIASAEVGLRKKFNITMAQYSRLYEAQNGECSICRRKIVRGFTGGFLGDRSIEFAHVDHAHSCCNRQGSCGKCIRGLLCRRCNMGISALGDNAEILQRAMTYLAERPLLI